MRRLPLILLMLAWATAFAVAQPAFHSARLRALDSLLGHPLRERPAGQERTVMCPGVVPGTEVKVVYRFDRGGVCDHIGLRFLHDTSFLCAQPQVQMLEREFLAQLVDPNPSHLLRTYGDNRVAFLLNGQELTLSMLAAKQGWLERIGSVESIRTGMGGNRMLATLVLAGGDQLEVSYPAGTETLLALDKREADARVAFQLQHTPAPETLPLPRPSPRLTKVYKGLYEDDGEEFVILSINNKRYYVKEGKDYLLAHDSVHYLESFVNTFLGYPQKSYTLEVKQKSYEKRQFTVAANAFFDYFADQKVYFGIENTDPNHLEGTIVIQDEACGIVHLCYVRTDLHTLLHGGTVSATLYTNIPQHNIKNLYGERELTK